MDRHALGTHGLERPVEHPAVTNRTMGPDPHPLPERATEVWLAQQGPVDARRRTLELVAAGDRVVRVEHVAELTGHASQLVDRDAALRAVDQQPQDQPSAFGAVLHVDELEPRSQDEGLRQLPDAARHRGRVHVMRSSKIKKWARGPLRLVSEGRKSRVLYHLAERPATAGYVIRSRVHLLDHGPVPFGHDLALHLEARRELPALRREITGEDAEVLDRLERRELAVHLPHLA